MGRAPCCDKANVKKGPWSPEEDAKLKKFIEEKGTGGNWITLPSKAELKRCGKSCRLRWINYLRPDIKHGGFTEEEEETIYRVHAEIGSRWSVIAQRLPGRTDNDIKNYWNTRLKKKLAEKGMNTQCRQIQRNYQNVLQNVQNLSAVHNFTGAHTGCSSEDLYQQLFQSQMQYYPHQSYNAMPQLTQQVTPSIFSQQQQHFAQGHQQLNQQQEEQNMMLAMNAVEDELVNGPTSTIPSAAIDENSLLRIESSFKSCIADSATYQQSPAAVPMSPATVLADISHHRSPTSPCSDSYGNSYEDSIRSGASQSLALLPSTNVEPPQAQHVSNASLASSSIEDGLLDSFSVCNDGPFDSMLSVKEEYSAEWPPSWTPLKGPITIIDHAKCYTSAPRCGAENVFSASHLTQMPSTQEQPHDYRYLRVGGGGVFAPEAAFADQLPSKDNNMTSDTEGKSLEEAFFRQAKLSSLIELPCGSSNMAIGAERQEEEVVSRDQTLDSMIDFHLNRSPTVRNNMANDT